MPFEKPRPLTRAEMEEKIDQGQSVLHKGIIITRKDQLPTDLDLAGEEVGAKHAALARIKSERDRLDALLQQHDVPQAIPPKPAEPVEIVSKDLAPPPAVQTQPSRSDEAPPEVKTEPARAAEAPTEEKADEKPADKPADKAGENSLLRPAPGKPKR